MPAWLLPALFGGGAIASGLMAGKKKAPQIDTSYIQRLLGEMPNYGNIESVLTNRMNDPMSYSGPERRMRSRGIESGYNTGVGNIRTSLAGRGMAGGPAEAALVARLSQSKNMSMEDLDAKMAMEGRDSQSQAIQQLLGLKGTQTQAWGMKGQLLGQENEMNYQNSMQDYYRKISPYKTLGDMLGTGFGASMYGMLNKGGGSSAGGGGDMDYSQIMKMIASQGG
jgi:hypothetical protein